MTNDNRHEQFRQLHEREQLFILPNPWDTGSARFMAGLGFEALATSSWAAAMSAGRMDGAGKTTLDVALEHAAMLVEATDLPVNADLEDGFGREPEAVAETVRQAIDCGLSGCSIEDTTGDEGAPLHEFDLAVERIEAAVDAARAAPHPFMLTARADGFSYGQPHLGHIIERLQAFEAVGADVLYAPELPNLDAVRAITAATSKPLNVVAGLGLPADVTVSELEAAGARRMSLGSSPYRAAMKGLLDALPVLLSNGDLGPLAGAAKFSVVEELVQRGTPT